MMILPLMDVMSMMKLSTIKIMIVKSKLEVNQIRIHNGEREKGKVVRSLLMEVRCNETISMEDWAIWIGITFIELPKWWVAIFK